MQQVGSQRMGFCLSARFRAVLCCAALQVNTKVDMRFELDKAGWIPDEVKEAIRRAVSRTT